MTHLFPPLKALRGFALVAMLSGCAAITALNDVTVPLEVYELRAPTGIAPTNRQLARDVIIELPTTSGALSTDRIMIRPNALQAQYLPDVRWSDPTPVMVQTLMLRAVEATNAVRYVGRQPLGANGDFAVVTELVDFQAEQSQDGEAAVVQLKLIVRVIRERDASIAASKTFTATSASPSTETNAVIEAFNTASSELVGDFATWLPTALRD